MEACIPGIPCRPHPCRIPGAKTATVCVCGVCDDDNDGGTHDNAVTTVCRCACLSKRTSFGTFHFLLGFRKDTPRSSRHLELLGASIELLGASLELLGASLELRGAALELLGASIELLGASLEKLLGVSLELLGASLELRGASLELRGASIELLGAHHPHAQQAAICATAARRTMIRVR